MVTLNPESIETRLFDSFLETLKQSTSRLESHNLLKKKIVDLASSFGLRAVKEYLLEERRDDGRRQFTDVVWLCNSTPIAAFEVDSSLRTKSLRKLLAIPAEFRFWIYYGLKDPLSFVSKIDAKQLIRLIYIPSALRKCLTIPLRTPTKSKVNSAMQEEIAFPRADQHIEQAIKHCWIALPEKERSLKRVEREITRLVQHAIKNAEEGHLTFSGNRRESPANERMAEIRTRYPRAYERWTEDEDDLLNQKFAGKATIQELSEFFQRQPGAIRSRLRKLGFASKHSE
jgi:hypothetical protein